MATFVHVPQGTGASERHPGIARQHLSVILPARNEALSLVMLLPELKRQFGEAEIIVVDDGSTDETAQVCRQTGVRCISHRYRMGNGAAVKTGVRAATGQTILLMDADGQHDVEDIGTLLAKLDEGYDMVVGARDAESQANIGRSLANRFYSRFASWMVGQRVDDLTSGFRVARTEQFKEFLHLLPNGFSYPTTCTMAFFRSGYAVGYAPIRAQKRIGTSHIRPMRDGLRFLLIMFRICTLYAPLKLFLPISATVFTMGLGYYLFTYFTFGRFTNMSALLFIAALLIFLIGLVSEQITMLLFQKAGRS
ncbi:MAG: glycosyltransferase family 2 protein [Chromatiales bacterium]